MIEGDSVEMVHIFVINQNNVPRMLQLIVCKKSVELLKGADAKNVSAEHDLYPLTALLRRRPDCFYDTRH